MIREIDLLNYLPQYVQEYKEIKEIMSTVEPELQLLSDETEVILNNQFILHCNTVGIKKFENMLGIVPSSEDDLQTRIDRVFFLWTDRIPYTYRVLIMKLNALIGNIDEVYELVPRFTIYELLLLIYEPLGDKLPELDELLYKMIPANIVMTSINTVKCELVEELKIGTAMIKEINYTINTNEDM